MTTKLDISELDLLRNIKENLKTFLSQQDEFRDYDFVLNMNILLDVLAYNTHYLNF